MTDLSRNRLLLAIAAFCALGAGAALAGHPLERHLRGGTLPGQGVFEIALERTSGDAYGGRVTIESLPAGRYAILLSRKARLEGSVPVIDGDVATIDDLSGPLTLRLNGVAAASITIAVMRCE